MKKFLKILGIGFLIIILLGLISLLGVYFLTPNKYNLLIIGSDQREGLHENDVSVKRGRSDVLMVVSIPKKSKDKMSILMIPRDTKIEDVENGTQKITHYYAMGERYESEVLGNMPLTKEKVEELLDEKMDATFELTFAGFEEIIDLLGGVETSVGHIDSAEAVEMVHNRFIHADGDFGRAEQQREILKGVMNKAKSYSSGKKIYDYIGSTEEVRLKYNKVKAAAFGIAFIIGHKGKIDLGEIEEIELPGVGIREDGLYYWGADTEAIVEIKKQYLK